MKKVMLLLAIALSVATFATAQKLDAAKVPAPVKTAFAKAYPATAAKWEKEDGKFEANFKQNGNTISVLYESNGTMTESEMDIKVTELPASVLSYVKAHYKGKSIKEAAKITKADGTINYEAEVNGKDVIFDASGNFLKEVKD